MRSLSWIISALVIVVCLGLLPSSDAFIAKKIAKKLALPVLAGGAAGAAIGLGAVLVHSHNRPHYGWNHYDGDWW